MEPLEARILLSGDPTLTIVLNSATMSELAGGYGVTATVQRTNADLSQSLTVSLQSSDPTEATVPTSVVIPAGAASASFLVQPVDDNLLDGPQTLQITASAPGFVYASSLLTSGLDPTYGTNGYSTVPMSWSSSSAYPDLVIQPDGATVVLAQSLNSNTVWTLARRTASGAVDASFGGNGQVNTLFPNATSVTPTALALQEDGKILAVGFASGGATIWNDMVVVRYNANGSLDTTFGASGVLRIERATHTTINDVSVLSDGSILLAGSEGSGTFLARLNPDGTLDTTFGTDGFVLTAPAGYSSAQFKSLEIQSDGSILAAGSAVPTGSSSPIFFVARYLPDGTLDATYGTNGLQFVDVNPSAATYSVLTNSVLQADGKLVLVGYDRVASTANENWAIARLNTDGTLDTGFSSDGVTLLDFNGSADYARDVVVQADGRILVMGEGFVSGNGYDLGVARFNPDGSLDTSFDGDGKLTLPNWSNTIWEQIWAGQLTADGQLMFLAGYSGDMRLGRLSLDSSTAPRDTLTVTDYETLTVTIVPTLVAENAGAAAVTGTVTRSNLGDLSSDLTVSLQSSDTSELTVPATVVIAAGQSSATFTINAVDDTIIDGTQRVTIRASANGYVSISDTLSVTDDDANVAPVASSQSRSVNEDAVLNGQVAATDADGDPLTYSIVTNAAHGQVSMNSSGQYTYTPDANFNGTDTFYFRAYDGQVYSNTATVSITVQAVNDAPVAVNDSYTINEDTVLVTSPVTQPVTLIQMTSDPGDYIGQGKTYNLSSGITASAANNGSLVRVNYQNPNNGSDYWTFEFESPGYNVPLTEGTYSGATRYPFNPEGTPGLSVTGQGRGSNTLTGFFIIDEISFSPTGTLQSLSISFEQHSEGSTPALRGTIQYNYSTGGPAGVLANDTDVDGNQLAATLVTGPQHGSVTLNSNGTFTYTPQADFYGTDSFTYVAGDGSLASNPATVFLTVNAVDEAPVIADQTFAIDENAAPLVSVGTVVASDGDAGQTLTYAITDSTHPGAFAIDPQTGEITVVDGTLLDFEQASSATLTVSVTDNGNPALSSSADITINIGDVNETPMIANQSFSISENSANGTAVGTVLAADVDSGQALTYSIAGTSLAGAFAINTATGQITVADSSLLNHEVAGSVAIQVAVTDSGNPALVAVADVTITIGNVNDAPVLADQSFAVREYLNSGSVVGTLAATDEDAGQTLNYAIVSSSLPDAFMIVPSTGQILVAYPALLDFETVTSVTLTVRATDSGNPSLSTTATVVVAINDVNESPVMAAQTFFVDENAANGTVVGTVVATDVDAGQSLTYEIFSSPVPGAFAIDAATGQITVADGSLLNFESRSSIELALLASDNGTPLLATFAPITINLTDINEAPVVTPATFNLNENSGSGTVVGTIAAADPDAGQALVFAITAGNANNAFAIDPATGALTVNNAAAIDFETTPTFSLTITATDNGAPAKSGSATVTVNLTNVNDAPAVTSTTFSLNENSATGTAVGTVAAADPDAGQALVYAITAGNTNNAFAIDPATGALTVNNAAAVDFETTPTFSLTVTATDNGAPAISGSATVTVNLANVNDAPVLPAQSMAVKTRSKAGTVVGTVVSSDQDAGQTRTYEIVSGNGGSQNVFAINATTGVITVKNARGVRSASQYDLVIRVTDNGSPALSTTGTVRIYVNSTGTVPLGSLAVSSAPATSDGPRQESFDVTVSLDEGTDTLASVASAMNRHALSGAGHSARLDDATRSSAEVDPAANAFDELFTRIDGWV